MSFNNLPLQQTQATNNSQTPINNQSQTYKSEIMCFSLYLIQGAVLSIGQTMPYLYKELPSYKTLAFFSMIQFPFSLKFLITPFMEKYTYMNYGKRKTWIVSSQIACSIFLFVSSFFTDVALASFFAFILMLSILFLAIQDISLDSLSIKQIRSAQRASMMQSIAQPLGTVVGSLFLLKLTSIEFAQKIGINDPITTSNNLIRIISFALMITAIMMHFYFRQTFLECQRRGNQKGFWQIIRYAKIFINTESKYSRTVIFILIYNQGLKFYQSGYQYQLIQAGFQRDNLNSISNITILPIIGLTVFMNKYINRIGIKNLLVFCILFQCALYTFNIYVFSLNPLLILFTQFLAQLCISIKSMILYIMINGFPIHALTGMFITIMLSFWNASQIRTLNTLLIDILGWRICASIGIMIQLFIVYKIKTAIFQWINQGTIEIDASIANDNRNYSNSTLTYSLTNQNLQPEQVELSNEMIS